MPRIKVPQPDGHIGVFDGSDPVQYEVKDGVITVPDEHVAGVLAGVAGSSLIQPPETPAKPGKPGSPAKEK